MTTSPPPSPRPEALLLERTRGAVVNVLVAVGVGIAASGWLLRWRDGWAVIQASPSSPRMFTSALVLVIAASYLTRRVIGGRESLRDPSRRARRFWLGHVGGAAFGSLALPLGLAHGWFVRPRLDAVAPYWIAALALGFLALPRAAELEGFDEPLPLSLPPSPPVSEAQA